jgi:signal transduction histidine kinase
VGQLVQAMGGEIKVDSAVNEGTSFQVTLPRFIAQTT